MTKEEEHFELVHKCFICGGGAPYLVVKCDEKCRNTAHKDEGEFCAHCWEEGENQKEEMYINYISYSHALPIPYKDLGFKND